MCHCVVSCRHSSETGVARDRSALATPVPSGMPSWARRPLCSPRAAPPRQRHPRRHRRRAHRAAAKPHRAAASPRPHPPPPRRQHPPRQPAAAPTTAPAPAAATGLVDHRRPHRHPGQAHRLLHAASSSPSRSRSCSWTSCSPSPTTGPSSRAWRERWETAPDGKSVTFYLRKGLKWSDGAPLTAKDIQFTFKSTMDIRTAAAPGPTSIINGYQDFRDGKIDSPPGLVIVDDNTFRVDFDTPNAGFVPSISFLGFQILPEHILGAVDPTPARAAPVLPEPDRRQRSVHLRQVRDRPVRPGRAQSQLLGPAGQARAHLRPHRHLGRGHGATAEGRDPAHPDLGHRYRDAQEHARHQGRQQARGGHLPDGADDRRPEVQQQARASGAGVRHRPQGHRQAGAQGLRSRRQQPHHRTGLGAQSQPEQVRVQPRQGQARCSRKPAGTPTRRWSSTGWPARAAPTSRTRC